MARSRKRQPKAISDTNSENDDIPLAKHQKPMGKVPHEIQTRRQRSQPPPSLSLPVRQLPVSKLNQPSFGNDEQNTVSSIEQTTNVASTVPEPTNDTTSTDLHKSTTDTGPQEIPKSTTSADLHESTSDSGLQEDLEVPHLPDRNPDNPDEQDTWTPEQLQERAEQLEQSARSFMTSRLGEPGQRISITQWERCYQEALQSLKDADAEETLGTQGLFPLQILQSMSQETLRADILNAGFLEAEEETQTPGQAFFESLGGMGPAQQHMNSDEDRAFYDEGCRFFEVPNQSGKEITPRAQVQFSSMKRTLKPHQLYSV